MKHIAWVVMAVVGLSSGRADADYAKAWDAAKNNLGSSIPAIAAIDVAAIVKLRAFGTLFDLARKEEPDIDQAYSLIKSACNLDLTKAVEGVVIAGDPHGSDEDVVVFLQLAHDRAKVSGCVESILKAVEKRKQTSVRQDGIYSVATIGRETAYFAWVAPTVVAFTPDSQRKATLARHVGNTGLAKSPVGTLFGKLDPRSVAFGAFKLARPFDDDDLPLTSGYGNATLAGATVTGSIKLTATTPASARELVTKAKREIAKDLGKARTPAAVKKVLRAITLAAAGSEISVGLRTTERAMLDAFLATLGQDKRSGGSSGCAAEVSQAMAKMEQFSAAMCGCKDKACADKVNEDLTKWGTEMAKTASKDCPPDPEVAKKAADVMTRYTECMTKLMMAGSRQP